MHARKIRHTSEFLRTRSASGAHFAQAWVKQATEPSNDGDIPVTVEKIKSNLSNLIEIVKQKDKILIKIVNAASTLTYQ